MAASVLSLRQLNRATLARQMLLTRERTSVVDAVARLCGLQAQLARPPFIGLWTRVAGFERRALLDDLLAARVVRATMMRATIHLVTADDYLAFRPVLQPGLDRALSWFARRLSDADRAAVGPDGRAFFRSPATFDALRSSLATRHPNTDHRALAYAVRLTVPLVQVPTADDRWGFPSAASFLLADKWLRKTAPPGRNTLPELIGRYLAAFGPASVADFRAWSGLPDVKDAFEALRPELMTFRDERKRELFDVPHAPRPDGDVPASVRFLPEYDNLLLAHADRTRVIAADHRRRVSTSNLQILATFLVDGAAAGTWAVEKKAKSATLVVMPFGRLTKATQAELEAEGLALLAFTEGERTSTRSVVFRKAGA